MLVHCCVGLPVIQSSYSLIFDEWMRYPAIYGTLHAFQQHPHRRAQRSSRKAIWDPAPFPHRPRRAIQRRPAERQQHINSTVTNGGWPLWPSDISVSFKYHCQPCSCPLTLQRRVCSQVKGVKLSSWAPPPRGPVSSDKASLLSFEKSRIKISPVTLAHARICLWWRCEGTLQSKEKPALLSTIKTSNNNGLWQLIPCRINLCFSGGCF